MNEGNFKRVTDVIFFSHGVMSSDDKFIVQPSLFDSDTQYFEVPGNTKIFEYYDPEADD